MNNPGESPIPVLRTVDVNETTSTSRSGPSLVAILTCWLRPATMAPEMADVKLRWAYLIHLLAGLAFFFGVLLLIQTDAWLRGSNYSVLEDVIGEFDRHRDEATLITAIIVASVEFSFFLLALCVLAWGAVDERLRQSWAHTLRFTWLHTTHAVALLLVIGTVFLMLENARRSYYRMHSPPEFGGSHPQPPSPPQNAVPNSQAWKDYQAAMVQYQKDVQDYYLNHQRNYQNWRRTQPFFVQHNEAVLAWLCIAGSTWLLWALFRSVGTRRSPAKVERPPTCEFCGYNLTGTAIERRCPECGVPAIESLGPQVRLGTAWERGESWRAWLRCSFSAMRRPRELGHELQITTQPQRHRRLLWSLVLPSALVGAVTLLISYLLIEHRNPWEYDPEVVTLLMPIVAADSGAGMLMIAMVIAAVVGMIQSWRYKRNLLPAAAQMVSHLSPLFLAGGLFMASWTILLVMSVREDWFRDWIRMWQIDSELLLFCLFVFPQLAWLALCSILVWKGTAAARYANR